MKLISNFLPALVIIFSSLSISPVTNTIHTFKHDHANGTLLVYAGSVSNNANQLQLGVRAEIDTTIGLRYEVVLESGSNVISHNAIFYKFSAPGTFIHYNYLTHATLTNSGNSGIANHDQDLGVIGKDVLCDSISCTHLQKKKGDATSAYQRVEDYWMSSSIPGYENLLSSMDKSTAMLGGGILTIGSRWGGLVKMVSTSTSKNHTVSANLMLKELNRNMKFPARDFDVPK